MKVLRSVLFSVVVTSTLLAQSSPDTIRVLFIGTSFTGRNDLPSIVREVATRVSRPGLIETKAIVGGPLMVHWRTGEALRTIRQGHWDYVVLQEQSMLGNALVQGEPVITDPSRYFWPHVRLFHAAAVRAGAKVALFQTWGQRGVPRNADALTHAYMTIGEELGALVVPVGSTWQRALVERANLPLWRGDGSHYPPCWARGLQP